MAGSHHDDCLPSLPRILYVALFTVSPLRSQILVVLLCFCVLGLILVSREQSNTIDYQRKVLHKQSRAIDEATTAVQKARDRLVGCEAVLEVYGLKAPTPEPEKPKGLTSWR